MHNPHTSPWFTYQGKFNGSDLVTGHDLDNLRLAVKELFDLAGIPTNAGNPTWLKSHPTPLRTSSVVRKLISNGAIFVGKTTTDELAYSLNGQNIHFPTLYNSLDNTRFCGGSSSGSALAVAMNEADIGLGTDTGGSIRVPASYNGLFGFRPSHGTVAVDNLVPLAPSFDTVGWITRDLATLIKVAQWVITQSSSPASDVALRPLIADEMIHHSEFEDLAKQWITSRFAQSVPVAASISMDLLHNGSDAFRVLQGRQIWQNHGDWIETEQPVFASDIQARFDWCKTLTKEQELSAFDQQSRFVQMINHTLGQDHYLIIPTTPGPAPRLDSDEKYMSEYRNRLLAFTCIAGLAGLPQLHLPLFRQGTGAFGLSLIGPKFSDHHLLQIGQDLLGKDLEA